jgi:ATP-dependent Clp protease ATP-binding subunit ClpA
VRLPQIDPAPDSVYPSKDFTAVLKRAQQEQKRRGDAYLGVDVLLLALLHDGEVGAAIGEAGMAKQALESALKEVRPEVSAGEGPSRGSSGPSRCL